MPEIRHIEYDGTTYDISVDGMTGASASTAGASGVVPAPLAGDNMKYLRGDGTWQTVNVDNPVQYAAMPSASVTTLGRVVQYIGASTANYTIGYFYRCIENNGDYSWENIFVQNGGGSGSGSSGSGGSAMFTGTLLANGWANNQQTVNINGITSDVNGVIGVLNTATDAQIVAAKSAILTPVSIGNGTITIKAENVPDVDIPFGVNTGGGGGGASDISDLGDVNLTSPTDGQVLKYDATNDEWVNGEGGGSIDTTIIAPEFDATESYSEGDRVTKDGKLYVFTDDHTGAWDVADVDETDVVSEMPEAMGADDLEDVKAAFVPTHTNSWNQVVIDERGNEYVVGKRINSEGVEKDLYQRIIYADSISLVLDNSVNVSQILDYSNFDFIEIVNCFAIGNNNAVFSGYWCSVFIDNNGYVKVQQKLSTAPITCKVYVTIRYTKSTPS